MSNDFKLSATFGSIMCGSKKSCAVVRLGILLPSISCIDARSSFLIRPKARYTSLPNPLVFVFVGVAPDSSTSPIVPILFTGTFIKEDGSFKVNAELNPVALIPCAVSALSIIVRPPASC